MYVHLKAEWEMGTGMGGLSIST